MEEKTSSQSRETRRNLSLRRAKPAAIIFLGLALRLAIAPVTGHPHDMSLWATSARLFYETGRADLDFFYTLPTFYYIILIFYAPYASLVALGFSDSRFLYHTSYMVEGVFLKLPMILSDLGIFAVLWKFTGSTRYAMLYFLNPFIIFLSAAWGTYDSEMMLPLVYGFLALASGRRNVASLSFAISGLVKLFGFIPFTLLVLESLVHKRFREFSLQAGLSVLLVGLLFTPVALAGGLKNFFAGFVLRFFGLGGGQTLTWNIPAVLARATFGGAPPILPLVVVFIASLFLWNSRRSTGLLAPLVLWSTVAAILIYFGSQAEPQWLSWVIPLSLLHAHLSRSEGLAYYSMVFGWAATFLTSTLLQGTGYIIAGLSGLVILGPLEGFSRAASAYVITITGLLVLLLGYLWRRPERFKLEIIPLVMILYMQVYFWIAVVRILPD